MNIEDLREYCLTLPDVTEKMPFEAFFHNHESLLAFYAGKHIFCLTDIEANDECTVKCSPERIAELEERFTAIGKPYNFSPGHWISIKFNGDVPNEMLLNLVMDSYNLVISKR